MLVVRATLSSYGQMSDRGPSGRRQLAVGSEKDGLMLDLVAVGVVTDHHRTLPIGAEMGARDGEDDDALDRPRADGLAVAELQRDSGDGRAGLTDDEYVMAGGLDALDVHPRSSRENLLAG